MDDIIIYGAGGFGRETALMIRQINDKRPSWNIIGFCDDNCKKGGKVYGLPVIGGLSELEKVGRLNLVIAVADPRTRKKIREKITNTEIRFPVLIHPSVLGGDPETNRIDEGSIIAAGNILTTNIHVKPFVIINLSCTIGHDVSIGEFSSIMPGCSISGMVNIEQEVLIGTGARILQSLMIGDTSRVGAGAVVTRSVSSGATVMGIPARRITKE
jgi:sugar O-acyltransferase (sialic acid O-acetyltransferase NeuD family)